MAKTPEEGSTDETPPTTPRIPPVNIIPGNDADSKVPIEDIQSMEVCMHDILAARLVNNILISQLDSFRISTDHMSLLRSSITLSEVARAPYFL